MTDIYDIKPLLLWNPINIFYSIIILIILIFYYYILFFRKNTQTNIKDWIITHKITNINYKEMISKLEKNINTYDENIFYSKINKILRLYLQSQWYKTIWSSTLKEIKNIEIDSMFKELFKDIYLKEYSLNIEKNIIKRKEYLEKIKFLILNK